MRLLFVMTYVRTLVSFFCVIGCLGCSESVDPGEPEGALHLLRNALMDDDMETVLDMSSTRTREDLEKMHALLKAQRAVFESEDYSLVEKMKARAAYPKEIRHASSQVELFRALISPRLEKMERDESLKFGLTSNGTVTHVDRHTSVSTHSGQSVGFVEENGQWKTTAFETSIHRNLLRVEANSKILTDNLAAIHAARAKPKVEKTKEPKTTP